MAKWSFVRQVSTTERGIKEQSLYGIEGWSLFRGCFTTRVHVAAIRTRVSGRYKAAGCSSGVVVKRGFTVVLSCTLTICNTSNSQAPKVLMPQSQYMFSQCLH